MKVAPTAALARSERERGRREVPEWNRDAWRVLISPLRRHGRKRRTFTQSDWRWPCSCPRAPAWPLPSMGVGAAAPTAAEGEAVSTEAAASAAASAAAVAAPSTAVEAAAACLFPLLRRG